jgi:hypothetical protein
MIKKADYDLIYQYHQKSWPYLAYSSLKNLTFMVFFWEFRGITTIYVSYEL